MADFRVIVTDDRYGNYTEENRVFKELGIEVEIHNLESEPDSKTILKNADAVLVNLFPMTKEIIDKLENCKIISRYGVGYDNVDVEAAAQRGIWVSNVPDYSMEDVSDHALALLMGSVRKIAYRDRMIRNGKWNLHKDWPSYRTSGKTLGLIGFGAIGRTFLRKVSGLGLKKVLIHDPFVNEETIKKAGGMPSSFDSLLRESDYISIHVPLTEKTKAMIGKNEFRMMKNSAILINTSRGPVIKGDDLYEALNTGIIAAAGIDVFENEPLPNDCPLKNLDNIIMSDHAGWYSEESIVELKTKAALNILEVLKGDAPLYPVNNPKL